MADFGDLEIDFDTVPEEVAPATALKKKSRGSGTTGMRGKHHAAADGKRYCKGCGDLHPVEFFGPKDSMCREAKAAYESAMTQAKTQGEVKFLKQLCAGRPEDFQLFLARFKVEAPRVGRGRVFFNIGRFRTYLESRQGVGMRWKARMMDQKAYVHWAKTVEGGSKTPAEAVKMWQAWETTQDKSIYKDHKGENGSLRIAVHVEDVIYGYTEVASGSGLERTADIDHASKEKIEDLESQITEGGVGLQGFKNKIFEGVGGSVGAALASQGRSLLNEDGSMGGMAIQPGIPC